MEAAFRQWSEVTDIQDTLKLKEGIAPDGRKENADVNDNRIQC